LRAAFLELRTSLFAFLERFFIFSSL